MKKISYAVMVTLVFCFASNVAASPTAVKKAVPKTTKSGSSRAMTHSCSSCHTLSRQEAATLLHDLGEVKDVKLAPVKGLFEVTMQRDNRQAIIYVDFGKKLLVPGPIFDIASKRTVTPPPVELPKILSKAELAKIPTANSIVMGNPSGKKRLFVFTDPDCSFCAKLHGELKKLVAMEPELVIYIKMFPLKMHPQAYDKARVLLGSKSLEMLEKAFAHGELPQPGDNYPKEPVDETIKLGESLGINGTPALILPDGRVIAGAREAGVIRELLQ
jgi:thiol:disulfide interchange protein DsbC